MDVPIVLKCQCGKRLKAAENLAGRRVKCPGCGRILQVPNSAAPKVRPATRVERPQSPPAQAASSGPPRLSLCPSCSKPLAPEAALCTECGYNLKTGKKLKPQTTREPAPDRPRREGSSVFAAIAAYLPQPGTTFKLLLLAAVIGAAGWWGYSFMNPPAVLEHAVHTVDAYAVADDLEPTTVFRHVEALGEAFGDFSLGGRHLLVITHPTAAGRFLRVQLKLSRRYLANHDKLQRGKFYLSGADIQLLGHDGQAVGGLFLTGQQRSTTAQINLRRLPENATLPFTGERLEKWRHDGEVIGEIQPNYRLDGVLQSIAGTWEFRGSGGLNVRLTGEGPLLKIQWETASTAWRAAGDIDDPAPPFETFGDWPVNILFPRPSRGPYQLKIGDQIVPL